MKKLVTCCLPFLLAVGIPTQGAAATPQQESASLKYKTVKDWETLLPNETWSGISFEIPIAHEGGEGFVVDNSAFSLAVDTSGNGKANEKIKGQGGFAVLKSKTSEGNKFQYAIRVR